MEKILILENHPITLKGISSILNDEFDQTKIFEANDSDSALDIIANNAIELIILSANNGSDNLTAIEKIKSSIPIVLYYRDFKTALDIKKKYTNVQGLLSQLAMPNELLKCVTATTLSQSYFCETTLRYTLEYLLKNDGEPAKKAGKAIQLGETVVALSKREKQIHDLIVQGKGTSEIATALNLKMSTISTVKHKILKKMKVTNVVELLRKYNSEEQ